MKDFRDSVSGVIESDYDRLIRSREHLFCLWNDHGKKCEKAAVFLTTVMATKIKHLPGGPHSSVLKGGYCAEHNQTIGQRESDELAQKGGGQDWRDKLVNSVLAARGFTPEGG